MKSITGRQKLYQDYIFHYESHIHEGNVTLCDHKLECRGDTQLCDCPAALGEVYSNLIRQNLESKKQEHRVEGLKQMMKGFAFLEIICVNLFLFPWRKEIRTLKKFTGHFVYFVEPVIPEETIKQILQQVGYSVASDTEYTIGGKINIEEAKQTAFELYLCRIECEKLLWLMKKEKSACISVLVDVHSSEASNRSEHTGKNDGIHEVDGINKLDFETGNDESTKSTHLNNVKSQDVLSSSSKHDSHYYNKHMDSDDFLNNYNDLNLAQQPILPLNSKQNKPKELPTPVYEEINVTKPCILECFEKEGKSSLLGVTDHAEKVTCGIQADNIDIRTFTDKLDPPKSLMPNECPAEVLTVPKQERVVTKLKMKNVPGESLAYPIEETLPPDAANFYDKDTSELNRREVKWAFLKPKEDTFTSPMSLSSDFSMLNISSKSNWTVGVEHRLREPPNSTYIPPVAPESECIRLTHIKPQENHFKAPSPPWDTLMVNEDTKEDYVMISKKDN
ncbi:hypothetical protein GDO81_022608 [Engystomops pustulosus]|uniref:Spermatogenesis-associated protein 2 PUB-like domain-containing protein n=1 Tax=Engystomops pustulosus TaxID=76066 RepID=A0AAV6ZAJ9_ENGPU|nr:hypothetical protein GDO81_022608 [Engystomops pustulosus]